MKKIIILAPLSFFYFSAADIIYYTKPTTHKLEITENSSRLKYECQEGAELIEDSFSLYTSSLPIKPAVCKKVISYHKSNIKSEVNKDLHELNNRLHILN